jgi:hypothetical protein
MEDFIPTGYTRIRITNNSFCGGCEKWFEDEERPRLVRIGKEKDGWADFHPECIEKALEKGILYYKEEDNGN